MINALEKYGEVCDKQIIDEDVLKKEEFQSDEEIFEGLEALLKTSDLVFAEVTVPSLGVGYELGFADQLGKKIIAIYDLNVIDKVSTMIRGNKRIKLIGYHDISEIVDIEESSKSITTMKKDKKENIIDYFNINKNSNIY